MKQTLSLLLLICVCITNYSQDIYDTDLVSFGSKSFNNEEFKIVTLKRDNNRVRVKYFASEIGGKSVGERYNEWSKNKNIICYSSGAYMSDLSASQANLVGLTFDYGDVVNQHLILDRLHALVVVYPNGNIDIANLNEGTLTFSGSGSANTFDLTNSMQKQKFIDWAKDNKLTIFQTHLLAFNNEILLAKNSPPDERERRFLVVAEKNGKEVQFIIHKEQYSSLLRSTTAVFDYLKSKGYSVKSLINLDTGAQDVFKFFNYDGTENNKLVTKMNVNDARNLIVYYYQ